MKFTISQEEMKNALGAVQGCVESKATIPVLRNTLIESTSDSQIRISATNLDIAIRKDAAAAVSEQGSICIPGRKLFDVVRSLPDGDITFESEEKEWVRVTCAKSKFRFAGVPKDTFPVSPVPKEMPITINGDLLADMIGKSTFTITNQASRFTLNGAKFIVKDGTVLMVATDGHRLAYIERTLPDGHAKPKNPFDVLIPKLALTEVAKMGHTGGIKIGEDQNHIFFNAGGQLLSARKLTGSFPNYEMVMPKDNDKCLIVDGADFKAAVRRIALMSDPRNQSMRIVMAKGEMRLFAQSAEEGEGSESVDAEYAGDETELGFNWHYLGEFLNIVRPQEPSEETKGDDGKSPKVLILFKDQNGQVELKIAGDDGFRYVVMPLRIN